MGNVFSILFFRRKVEPKRRAPLTTAAEVLGSNEGMEMISYAILNGK